MQSRLLLLLTISPLIHMTANANAETSAHSKIALLVGVTKYQHASFNRPQLQFPENDARELAKTLEASGYQVRLLLGPLATGKRIREELKNVANSGDSDGVLILGFFGHGVQYDQSAYFCPYDTTLRAVRDNDGNIIRHETGLPKQEADTASMISMLEMLDTLALSQTQNRLLLADCCRNNPNALGNGPQSRAFGSSLRVDQLPTNCAAMFACSSGEKAYEHEDWGGHGAFTKAILMAMEEHPPKTVNELSAIVYYNVKNLVKAKNQEQQVNSLISGGVVELKMNSAPPAMHTGAGKMVLIPATSPAGQISSVPLNPDFMPRSRQPKVSQPYYIAEAEVTRGQWKNILGTEPWTDGPFLEQNDNFPVTLINCYDAMEFCRALSVKERRTYRLPTEDEWEHACRARASGKYCFGNDQNQLSQFAWFKKNSSGVMAKVKQKKANQFGLFDMHGNVFEWCIRQSSRDLVSHAPFATVIRGGAWNSSADECRASYRQMFAPENRAIYLGFRVVLEVEDEN